MASRSGIDVEAWISFKDEREQEWEIYSAAVLRSHHVRVGGPRSARTVILRREADQLRREGENRQELFCGWRSVLRLAAVEEGQVFQPS